VNTQPENDPKSRWDLKFSPAQRAEMQANAAIKVKSENGRHSFSHKTKTFVPANSNPLSGVDRTGNTGGFEYCKFPAWVLNHLLSLDNPRTALAVLVCLYEIHFRDWEHRNPVKLTTCALKKYRISRGQKARALKNLERLKIVSVECAARKNPKVLLCWLLPKGRPAR
jgi:hypothetical protein